MRIIFKDKKGEGRDLKRIERADKLEIRRNRRAKQSHLFLANAVL